jgi:2,3-bisphosphoglycerate-dependent phosphoglycerate mutase
MSAGDTGTETQLALVRHGESEGNSERRFGGHTDTPLTEAGRRQAAAAGAALASPWRPTLIISSDLARAVETAELIAAATGLSVSTTPGLRERGLGRLDGMTFAEVQERHPHLWAGLLRGDPDWRVPQGESMREAFQRVSSTVEQICQDHPGARIVVVSHAFAIFHAFAHVCGIEPWLGVSRVFVRVKNASITRVTRLADPDAWRIDSVNDTAHLDS